MNIDDLTPEKYKEYVNSFRKACDNIICEKNIHKLSVISNILRYPMRITFSDSVKSIKSYGCILRTNEEIPQYLCVKRKYSVDYTSFVLGIYKFSYLPIIITRILPNEREKILNLSFEELWNDLSFDIDNNLSYDHALYMYDLIKPYLSKLFQIPVDQEAEKNLWIFPKGKRNRNINPEEKYFDCAKREFEEETSFKFPVCEFFSKTYTESFTASNGEIYSTTYYLISPKEKLEKIKEENRENLEIEEVRWMSFDEIKQRMTKKKIEIIEEIESEIKKVKLKK